MAADDITATLDLALEASGLDQATVSHRPRLLSDNGPSYVSADLAKWLHGQAMDHEQTAENCTSTHTAPPRTTISRRHSRLAARP